MVIESAAGTDADALTAVDSAESAQLFTEADGSESFDIGLIEHGTLKTSALMPDGSGIYETAVTVEARLRVESSGDDVLARETAR